jgi:hypothetical protein
MMEQLADWNGEQKYAKYEKLYSFALEWSSAARPYPQRVTYLVKWFELTTPAHIMQILQGFEWHRNDLIEIELKRNPDFLIEYEQMLETKKCQWFTHAETLNDPYIDAPRRHVT